MREVITAAIAAIVAAYPGYLTGKRVMGRRRTYLVLFWGALAVMVGVVTWGFTTGRSEVAWGAIGVAFGFINGLRHGFSPVFAPLLHATQEHDSDNS